MTNPLPRLTLCGAKDAEDAAMLLHDQDGIRREVFQIAGVIIPTITYDPDVTTETGRWEVRLDGEVISSGGRGDLVEGMLSRRVVTDLLVRASAFVVPVFVAQRLQMLNDGYPDLVRAASAAMPAERLTERLQERVAAHSSIRDFRGALETVLAVEQAQSADRLPS
jgi:type III secretory pathway component EscV